MMITHPENLSKERLKTELKNHGVRYNNNENKQYYVSLYRKRVMGSDEARQEFSSDEEFSQHAGRSERKQQVSTIFTLANFQWLVLGVLDLENM